MVNKKWAASLVAQMASDGRRWMERPRKTFDVLVLKPPVPFLDMPECLICDPPPHEIRCLGRPPLEPKLELHPRLQLHVIGARNSNRGTGLSERPMAESGHLSPKTGNTDQMFTPCMSVPSRVLHVLAMLELSSEPSNWSHG